MMHDALGVSLLVAMVLLAIVLAVLDWKMRGPK